MATFVGRGQWPPLWFALSRLRRQANGSLGHATEVQGLHCLAAAFEDEADRRILF
jgi:hypothetical protein